MAILVWSIGFLAGGIGASYGTNFAWLLSGVASLLVTLIIGFLLDKK